MNSPHPSGKPSPPRRLPRKAAVLALAALAIASGLWIALTHRHAPAPPAPVPAAHALREIRITPPENPLPPDSPAAMALAPASAEDRRELARIGALRALAADPATGPDADEARALLASLLAPRQPGAAEGPHSAWFHEAALVLRPQAALRNDFARVLATVARDPSCDPVVRDYAIQHLRQLGELADPPLAAAVLATFREISADSPSMAPSAVLALHLAGSRPAPADTAEEGDPSAPPAASDDELVPRVRSLLRENRLADPTAARLTALRVIGERRLPGFHDDLARIAAATSGEHALVRMAAIAAIARFGDPADLALLESLDRSDPRLATAIDHAIASLPSKP